MNHQLCSPPAARPRSRYAWVWPLCIAALIILASHRPRLASPQGIPHLDKIVHFAVYGLLATLVVRLGRGWRAATTALVLVSLFGATDEWHQSFVPGRTTDVADWCADTIGAALAVALYAGWPAYRALLERELRQRRIENAATVPTLDLR